MYAAVRQISETNPALAWEEYRARRDEMFRSHPQSPLEGEARARFNGLRYFPYDPAWRSLVRVTPIENQAEESTTEVVLPEGMLRYKKFATVSLPYGSLTVFWMQGYGGGLFLPFRDLTNGKETYGGGRYLYDTIKGADLGAGPGAITLDFNFAYNPSCAYSVRWFCPLAPKENAIPTAVEAGERAFS